MKFPGFLLPKKCQPTPGPSRWPLLNGCKFLGKCPKNKERNEINQSYCGIGCDKKIFNKKQGKGVRNVPACQEKRTGRSSRFHSGNSEADSLFYTNDPHLPAGNVEIPENYQSLP